MLIAVMSDRAELTGRVPDCFETSPSLLLVETDGDRLIRAFSGASAAEYARKIVESGCEAIVCGCHIGQECFDPIADACVTRYDGGGREVLAAAHGAENGTLPLIPEYEGGPGCSSGGGSCDCGHDEDADE